MICCRSFQTHYEFARSMSNIQQVSEIRCRQAQNRFLYYVVTCYAFASCCLLS